MDLLGGFSRRASSPERLDAVELDDAELSRLFDFQNAVSGWTGGRAIVRGFLRRSASAWTGPITVLEMGCGLGDLSRALALWARGDGADLRLHAVDRQPRFIEMARKRHHQLPEITFETRALDDPFFLQARQFDYFVSEMALHRETDERAALFLKTANRVARRGLVVVDWLRDPRPAVGLAFLSWFWKSPAVRHDARAAVRRAHKRTEVEALCAAAGLEFARVRTHFGCRYSVEGERGIVREPAFSPITGLAT